MVGNYIHHFGNFAGRFELKMEDPSRSLLRNLLNKNLKIELSDGRILVGMFLCTDKDANVILVSLGRFILKRSFFLLSKTNSFHEKIFCKHVGNFFFPCAISRNFFPM